MLWKLNHNWLATVFVHFLFIYFTGENANKETSTNPQRMLGLTFWKKLKSRVLRTLQNVYGDGFFKHS